MGDRPSTPPTSAGGSPPAARVHPGKLRVPDLPDSGHIPTAASRQLAEPLASITLLVAPPGAGKTLTLASWVHQTPGLTDRIAWVSFDAADDDLRGVWSAVLAALQASVAMADHPEIGDLAPATDAIDALLVAMWTAVAARPEPMVLVLDDLQAITDARALASLEALVLRPPPELSLVLSAHQVPPFALHRLRLDGSLREIHPEAFTLDRDAARTMLASLGHPVSDEVLTALWAQTEGWGAGLRLAAAELATSDDPTSLADRFDGSTPAVATLLHRVVLDQLDAPLRQLLLATAACRELTPDLATALTGRADAGAQLDTLARRNALTQRVPRGPDDEPIYRYHTLLRGMLADHLQRTDPTRWRRTQATLVAWYSERRAWRSALEHAVASEEIDLVREVLRGGGVGLILDGAGPAVERLLEPCPATWKADPLIGSVLAEAALDRFAVAEADARLAAIDPARSPEPDDRWLRALQTTVDLHRARLGTEVHAALRRARAANDGDTGDLDVDLLSSMQRGITQIRAGEVDRARRDLDRASHLAEASGRDGAALVCASNLAALVTLAGAFPQVERHRDTVLRIARRRGWQASLLTVQAHVIGAWWALLRGQTPTARREIAALPEAAATLGNPDMRVAATAMTALTELAEGAAAQEVAARLRQAWRAHADAALSPALACLLIPVEVELWIWVGERGMATEAAECRADALRGTAEQVLVDVLLAYAAGAPARTMRSSLTPVLDGARTPRAATNAIRAWLLEARLAADAGAQQAAFDALSTALRLAEPDQLRGLVAWSKPGVLDVLEANQGRFARQEDFATSILALRPAVGTSPGQRPRLTPSELAILAELPRHRSVGDIATLRGTSPNTVKSHLRSLYRKLGVSNRRDAVRLARQHDLL